MAISAIMLLILGIALICFGGLSFQNFSNMPFMDDDMDQAHKAGKRFAALHIKVSLIGAILLAIGAALASLSEV